MEKVINRISFVIALVIFKIDNMLYKTLGFVSSYRKHAWTRASKRLQRALDSEHSLRDHLNALNGTSYTTKQALLQKD